VDPWLAALCWHDPCTCKHAVIVGSAGGHKDVGLTLMSRIIA
jgi:hypothetical protein